LRKEKFKKIEDLDEYVTLIGINKSLVDAKIHHYL